jgi:hypothetical protein
VRVNPQSTRSAGATHAPGPGVGGGEGGEGGGGTSMNRPQLRVSNSHPNSDVKDGTATAWSSKVEFNVEPKN